MILVPSATLSVLEGSPEARPLHRGISYAHLKATKGGKTLKLPVTVVEKDEAKVDSHGYYFMLPDLRVLPSELSQIIKEDLLDMGMMKNLQKNGERV